MSVLRTGHRGSCVKCTYGMHKDAFLSFVLKFAECNNSDAVITYKKNCTDSYINRHYFCWILETTIFAAIWIAVWCGIVFLGIAGANRGIEIMEYLLLAAIPALLIFISYLAALFRNTCVKYNLLKMEELTPASSSYIGEDAREIIFRNDNGRQSLFVEIAGPDMPDLVFELHTSYKLLYPADSSSITVKSTLLEVPVSTGTGLLAYIRSYVLFLAIFLTDFICFKKNLLIKFGLLQSGRIKQQFTASLNSDKGSSVEFIYKGGNEQQDYTWRMVSESNKESVNTEYCHSSEEIKALYKKWNTRLALKILLYFIVICCGIFMGIVAGQKPIIVTGCILAVIGAVETIKLSRMLSDEEEKIAKRVTF